MSCTATMFLLTVIRILPIVRVAVISQALPYERQRVAAEHDADDAGDDYGEHAYSPPVKAFSTTFCEVDVAVTLVVLMVWFALAAEPSTYASHAA